MGVLDDAIREHLDLKRRHGAAEEELRRQEAEALGPARREVAPAEAEDGDGTGEQVPAKAEVEADAAHAVEPEHVEQDPVELAEGGLEPEPLAEAEFHSEPELHAEPEAEPELEPEAEPELHAAREPQAEAELEDDLPFDTDEHARASDTPTQGFQAVGYDDQEGVVRSHGDELLEEAEEPFDEDGLDDEEEDSGATSADDADLLEDTPDFLQETPEHDRLWFEQKPPRDFDFD
jgi:hypothetical protein